MMRSDPAFVGLIVFKHRKIRDPEETEIAALKQAMFRRILLSQGDAQQSSRGVDGELMRRDFALARRMVFAA